MKPREQILQFNEFQLMQIMKHRFYIHKTSMQKVLGQRYVLYLDLRLYCTLQLKKDTVQQIFHLSHPFIQAFLVQENFGASVFSCMRLRCTTNYIGFLICEWSSRIYRQLSSPCSVSVFDYVFHTGFEGIWTLFQSLALHI